LAQLVNVIAPIRSEPGGPAWRQASFYPFALTSRHGRGTVLHTDPVSPVHETAVQGEVPILDAVAVHDEESGGVTLFLVNRDQREELTVDLDLRGVPGLTAAAEHVAIHDADPDAVNTADQPDRVVPRRLDPPSLAGGRATVTLPALSWNMLRLRNGR
jgi:alpha-N-arabinofuranosidase